MELKRGHRGRNVEGAFVGAAINSGCGPCCVCYQERLPGAFTEPCRWPPGHASRS